MAMDHGASSFRTEVERGFSLPELIVVLALAGVLAALAAPLFINYWRTSALHAGARELATTINLGRQLAISKKVPVCVDLSGTEIRLRIGGCHGSFWTGPVTDAAGIVRISDPATLGISSNARLVFTALGAATPSATYTVTHTRTDVSRAVVVAASGRITIE